MTYWTYKYHVGLILNNFFQPTTLQEKLHCGFCGAVQVAELLGIISITIYFVHHKNVACFIGYVSEVSVITASQERVSEGA